MSQDSPGNVIRTSIDSLSGIPHPAPRSLAHSHADLPLFLGCAGWSIASRYIDDFPRIGTHLERYARVFNAVEINSSFYRSHQQQTYARWRQSVPREFRFSVKIPRTVTHNRRLHNTQDLLLQFVDEVAGLQEKLGCLLVQLPPSLHFEESVAFRFFTLARRYFSCQIACEARHASWFASSASLLLNECSITRVFADPAIEQNNGRMPTTATGYRRLHGQPRMYYSAYGLSYLRRLADELIAGAQATALQWCIFDNTAEGAATSDALLLKSILDPGTVSQAFNGPPDGEVT